MSASPTIVIPAAGRSSRFESVGHKLGQPLGASTLLAATVSQAQASGLPLVVVTTAALRPLLAGLVAARDIVEIADADQCRGMGFSIAAGVVERTGSPGWVVLPADMPMVRPLTLLAVAAALGEHAVACAQYEGRRGHPVGFGAELLSDLSLLRADDGVRRLMSRYPAHAVEVDDPGVLVDVDTQADLDALRTASADPSAASAASA